jgi:hypothetical protein
MISPKTWAGRPIFSRSARDHPGQHWTQPRTGRDDLSKDVSGKAHLLQKREGPTAGTRVAQLGGGGVGVLAGFLARKPVADEIGDHQQRLRRPEKGGIFHRQKLVEGIYRHELDTRCPVYFFFVHPLDGPLFHTIGTRVAVVVRVRDQAAVPVQEGEVHPPGVHTQALDAPGVAGGFREPFFDLADDPQHVPVQTVW